MNNNRYRPRALIVLFDERCAFCGHCVKWLQRERCYLPLTFLPLQAPETLARFPELSEEIKDQRFIVIDDRGGVYLDSAGRLMCLYATMRYRQLALGLSNPMVKPVVGAVLNRVSRHRHFLSWLLGLKTPELYQCQGSSCSSK